MRDNGLTAFPPEAYDEDVVVRRFFGRQVIVMSRPAGIQHILVDNPTNYRRTPASIRVLRPLLGNGVLLSEGEDWRQQRRTLAPAFAPRTLAILARHVARAAVTAVTDLKASCAAPVDLLAQMQFLALEIAGTSMFSLETALWRRIASPDHQLHDQFRAPTATRFCAADRGSEPARSAPPTLPPALARPDRTNDRCPS